MLNTYEATQQTKRVRTPHKKCYFLMEETSRTYSVFQELTLAHHTDEAAHLYVDHFLTPGAPGYYETPQERVIFSGYYTRRNDPIYFLPRRSVLTVETLTYSYLTAEEN